MSDDPGAELEFPLQCHFRVITENLKNMHFVVETVLMELGVHDPVEKANASETGKYISFNISTVVESREQMTRIDKELRLIQGVKMVL
jgi:putative lipoic acid-binding regulatory protein